MEKVGRNSTCGEATEHCNENKLLEIIKNI